MFNTLRYAKMLEEVGFSREQAETSVKILVEIMEEKLASKQDLQDLNLALHQDINDFKTEVRQDIHDFKVEVKQDINDFKVEFRNSLQQVESKLTIRMGTMMAASIVILTAILKLT